MYENPDDTEPVFDAKGIETVRRDGVPAVGKMLETCLKYVTLPPASTLLNDQSHGRILFRSQDLSEVKEYCIKMWTKILQGRVPVQDFIFAKEVRMGTYRSESCHYTGYMN